MEIAFYISAWALWREAHTILTTKNNLMAALVCRYYYSVRWAKHVNGCERVNGYDGSCSSSNWPDGSVVSAGLWGILGHLITNKCFHHMLSDYSLDPTICSPCQAYCLSLVVISEKSKLGGLAGLFYYKLYTKKHDRSLWTGWYFLATSVGLHESSF